MYIVIFPTLTLPYTIPNLQFRFRLGLDGACTASLVRVIPDSIIANDHENIT